MSQIYEALRQAEALENERKQSIDSAEQTPPSAGQMTVRPSRPASASTATSPNLAPSLRKIPSLTSALRALSW